MPIKMPNLSPFDKVVLRVYSGNGSALEQMLSNERYLAYFYQLAYSQGMMNAIANSQTAMNAIKNNSTALARKEVPQMTSNTSPEGRASASSIWGSSYDAWRAFDKTGSPWWSASGSAPPQWVQYQFSVPVFVHTVSITGVDASGYYANPTSITIQASSDGVNFIDVATYNNQITNTTTTIEIAKQGYYRYWRLRINSSVTNQDVAIRELNFIGFAQPT